MRKGTATVLSISLLFLVACRREQGATPTEIPPPAATSAPIPSSTPTVAPTMTPGPALAPTVAPTPLRPDITVNDQPLSEDGRLVVESVVTEQAGWLVIHAQREGQVAEVLGYAAVAVGENSGVAITIDPLQATNSLVAMLHMDAGKPGEFEFPGADSPVQQGASVVSRVFQAEPQFALPAIEVSDQEVEDDGVVRVDEVVSPGPGWLFIHADSQGTIGPELSFVRVTAGVNRDLRVPIQWRMATPQLYAILYKDEQPNERYDEGVDLPLLVKGSPVVTPFDVSLPPDVFVLDQPVVNGEITIERVISQGPSWLVVYFEEDGDFGRIIGFAPLQDGLNERVAVALVEEAVTPVLRILLHEDTVAGDEFDFPAADGPITYDGRLPAPFTFRTDAGNYIATRDQTPVAGEDQESIAIVVPLVVVDSQAWVVVLREAEEEGGPGDIIGTSLVPAGISRDVRVEVDASGLTDRLYGALYLDAGVLGEFEFPDGPDVPLQRSRQVIQSPFSVIASPES